MFSALMLLGLLPSSLFSGWGGEDSDNDAEAVADAPVDDPESGDLLDYVAGDPAADNTVLEPVDPDIPSVPGDDPDDPGTPGVVLEPSDPDAPSEPTPDGDPGVVLDPVDPDIPSTPEGVWDPIEPCLPHVPHDADKMDEAEDDAEGPERVEDRLEGWLFDLLAGIDKAAEADDAPDPAEDVLAEDEDARDDIGDTAGTDEAPEPDDSLGAPITGAPLEVTDFRAGEDMLELTLNPDRYPADVVLDVGPSVDGGGTEIRVGGETLVVVRGPAVLTPEDVCLRGFAA